eukprot:scaffold196268_cov52-Attheya_sp.AAC.1
MSQVLTAPRYIMYNCTVNKPSRQCVAGVLTTVVWAKSHREPADVAGGYLSEYALKHIEASGYITSRMRHAFSRDAQRESEPKS